MEEIGVFIKNLIITIITFLFVLWDKTTYVRQAYSFFL